MGHTLQAPLHAEASAQTIVAPDREPVVAFYGPEAVVIGGSAPLAQDLSRASRTRWVRLFHSSTAEHFVCKLSFLRMAVFPAQRGEQDITGEWR